MELFSRRCNVSPLILAFIFITFFHNVLSRHRIRHYKDRFKRQQGANLYLPGSYVTDGGEGPDGGPWSEWSEPSPCSRTCGGGVSSQYRSCAEGYECQGPQSRHFSCNTQDCPDTGDFRAQQCSEYDNIPFQGIYYQWVPYTRAPNPCELNCMPKGERFYYRHAASVVDGTKCDDQSLDVCVAGKCQPVGCDMMLGSNVKEDLCRVCGGNGSTCTTTRDTIPMTDKQVGYNDIILIPAGATNIRVEEMGPSNNYLAVRNTSGHYYLNGNWRIDFPRTLYFAGCNFHYERSPQGFSAPDIITCLGPTDEALFIVLLFQDSDIPVEYTYSYPRNVLPGLDKTYAWTFDQFTPCSQTCGGGYQFRNVTCAERKTLEPADRGFCNEENEPEAKKRCNEIPCEAQWTPHPWGQCTAPCGKGGTQTREVSCQQISGNGYPVLVDESECLKLKPKPPVEQKCNENKTCAQWHTGPWKPCDHLCGDGTQSRKITCYIKNEAGKIEVLEDSECEAIEPKPEEEKKCNVRPCEGVDWITSEWSGCDRICGLTNETRKIHCATSSGKVYPDDLCEAEQKPESVRKCESSNATCQYLWYASQWSECSVECGEGVQTRTIFCGVSTVDGVKKVENEKCDQSKNFETIKACVGEAEECEGEWFSGPWGKCSKSCGGGERTKKVVCLKDNEVVNPILCGSDKIVFSHEECNTHPCSEDTIMSTDITHPVDESETVTEQTTVSYGSTDESEPTLPTDTTTEQSDMLVTPPEEEEEAEYEIVPATTCDDGEWVESDEPLEKLEEKENIPVTTESSAIETSFSMDDLMLSDGTTAVGDESDGTLGLETGSGDGEVTGVSTETSIFTKITESSDSTDQEGSGTGPTIISSADTEISTDTLGASQTTSEVSGITTEASSDSSDGVSTVSGRSEADTDLTTEGIGSASTDSSKQSSVSDSTGLSSDVTTNIADTEQSTESSSSSGTTESGASDLTTSSDGASSISTDSSAGSDATADTDTTETGITSSDSTKLTDATESPNTDTTNTDSSVSTDTSGSTDVTTESGTSESDSTGSTDSTESTNTETTETTPPSDTTETTDSTESTITETSGVSSSESDVTDTTDSTGSTNTEITETGTSESDTTGSTDVTESGGTDTTDATVTSDVSSDTGETSTSSSSDGSEATVEFLGESDLGINRPTGASSSVTEVSGSDESTTEYTTSSGITGISEVTESTEAVTEVTTEFGSTEVGTEFTTIVSAETESSGGTTPKVDSSEVTTEVSGTGATTEISGSTEATSEGGSTESTIEVTTSSLESSSEGKTDATDTTESSDLTKEWYTPTGGIESSTVSELDIFENKTTESVKEGGYPTTSIVEIFKKRPKMCKRRKIKACKKTQYGCCWDNITPAEGPFDKGCPTPKTCKESKYGCCNDGVSAALGPKNAGCPSSHCNETLFGCCPDNKTQSQGNNNEGCPEPPPECLKSKFGCCNDNVTEAKGPDHKGCDEEETTTWEPDLSTTEFTTFSTEEPEPEVDCNNTTYRCCPDGVTVAQGPGFQGCNLPCSNSTFGCCQDGATPAHGPSGEGCCLSSPYGCCPDNVVPARGPNLDGCGCQYSPYGCCPDNSTSARGYDNEGCGCQYTPHGCCPDSFTPANGPNYEGCLCHTFQFGCCPDGLTAARGPHHQGCGCRNTEFGCCPDEKTPASGPNREGCGCVSSKYGCCLDGTTEALGENFEGCETAPQDLQASCSLAKERGKCRNYTVKWFFDMDYGGCSRFWYGGCDGNGNRYKSKEECDQVCVEPQGTDRCNLPKVPGPCEGYYVQWYFDRDLKQCAQFIYGGCLGNNNRFETREECMGLCVKDSSVDACEQPKEEGPCKGQYPRYFFDKESDQCLPFTYGGCKGNNNNFATTEACSQKCSAPGRKKDHCSLPRAQGNCTEKLPRWYYDTPEKRCVPFYYSGCNGNQNNFENKEACENDCPMEVVKDTCHLPAETGECGNYVNRWYFDTKEKLCRQFYYGGCGGNENNFDTQERCQQQCEGKPTEPEEPTEPQPTQAPGVPIAEPFRTDMCFLPNDAGPCRNGTVRYYYDRADGVCKSFTYGGCDGNRNNFISVQECAQYCGSSQDLCTLPPVVGPCDGEYLQYYYEPTNDTCQPFTFGGCGGNYNRFQDIPSCEQRCKKTPPSPVVSTQAPAAPSSNTAMCYQPSDSGNCTENYVAFFFDPQTSKCVPFTYTGCGGNDNRFTSEEQCERQCGSFRGQDVCNMEKDPGPCKGYFLKYYYDKPSRKCNQFAFGGCQGNGNRFSSNEECERVCLIRIDPSPNNTAICQLPVDQGSCPGGYHKRWYFDDQRGECIAFIYSGCGGNFNNFISFQSCLDTCRDLLPPTQLSFPTEPTGQPVHPCQQVFDECATLKCEYGVEAYVDENECNRCQCNDPCRTVECPEGEQCAIDLNRNKTSSSDGDIIAICRQSNKPGSCPTLQPSETNCERECATDADCTLHLKCCSTGCGSACVDPIPPQELHTQAPTEAAAYTEAPPGLQPPKIDTQIFEPEVSGLIGDQAILRCAVTGNPRPRIRWSKDNFEIDGTQPRYRIKLDQSLQIITLHKTDSGIYLCTADNRIGRPVTNQIKLEVVDSEPRPATILDQTDEPPLVVSLNAPTRLHCFAMGYPFPAVTWWKDDSLIPLKNNEFEVNKDHSLLIHSVKLHNLGIYTCQAYNGKGKASSWSVTLRAKGPYRFKDPAEFKYRQYIVNPPDEPTTTTTTTTTPLPPRFYVPYRPTPEPYIPPTSHNEISNEILPGVASPPPAKEVPPVVYVVPVRANITTNDRRYPVGSDIDIPCEVIGYPTPQVQWYKDGVAIYPSDRIQISDSNKLTILKATKADSGLYQCEATNAYSKASSTLEISIEGMYIHPSCTDNQFFADCSLIVKANFCTHRYYAKFCCRSCTEAGLLPVAGSHVADINKQKALDSNLV